jgi:hypothetical protein
MDKICTFDIELALKKLIGFSQLFRFAENKDRGLVHPLRSTSPLAAGSMARPPCIVPPKS